VSPLLGRISANTTPDRQAEKELKVAKLKKTIQNDQMSAGIFPGTSYCHLQVNDH